MYTATQVIVCWCKFAFTRLIIILKTLLLSRGSSRQCTGRAAIKVTVCLYYIVQRTHGVFVTCIIYPVNGLPFLLERDRAQNHLFCMLFCGNTATGCVFLTSRKLLCSIDRVSDDRRTLSDHFSRPTFLP